uniref:Myb-like domain-containing protein n=1 Tax=Arion vulgaris TaxID=1028688 RepID=A0A0B6Z509_9EUPU
MSTFMNFLVLISQRQVQMSESHTDGCRYSIIQTKIMQRMQKNNSDRYNQILVEGLPDWRQTVYYYRRARKMGIYELGIVLSMIITVGQYLVAWAVYVEKRLVMEEVISSKKKKEKKKKKQFVNDDVTTDDDELNAIPTPHFLDLWPFRLSVFMFYTVRHMPATLRHWKEEKKRRIEEEEEAKAALEKEAEVEEIVRKPKKRVPTELPEYTSEMYAKFSAATDNRKYTPMSEQETRETTTYKKGDWSHEELVLLSKAVNKFPGGFHQRWEKIADMVGRPVNDVIAKTKETKGNYSMHQSMLVQSTSFNLKNQIGTITISDEIITTPDISCHTSDDINDDTDIKKRQKAIKLNKTTERTLLISQGDTLLKISNNTNKVISVQKDNIAADLSSAGDNSTVTKKESWTQNQQKIFEWALKQYPKGTDKRWDQIAEHIPGKSKEDCISRFKMLAELVTKRKKTDIQDVKPS